MAILLIILTVVIIALYWFTRKVDRGIDSAFTPEGRITSVTGGTIHWQKQGEGPALILIHGLLGNGKNFAELAEQLASSFTVYRMDRPGSGFSSRHAKTDATFEQQSAMILEWMAKEGISHAALAGHSMGGGIALRMALDAPHLITSVSLLCPLTTPLTKGAGPLSMLYLPNEIVRRSVTHTLASPLRVRFGKKQMGQIFSPEPVPVNFATEGGGLLALHSRSFYEGSRDTVSAQGSLHRQQRFYDRITCPVGVLYGDMDAILDPQTHTRAVTEKLPHCVAETIQGAGHMIPITQPHACAEFIKMIEATRTYENQTAS